MQTVTQTEILMYTDGACRGNPGPGGWAVLLRKSSYEKSLSGFVRQTTNNRMELTAVIAGLRALKRSCSVVLLTDSRYVQQGIVQWMPHWKQRRWRNARGAPVKNRDLWESLDTLCQQHCIDWCWVKAHSGHPENDYVDTLAKQAIVDGLNS